MGGMFSRRNSFPKNKSVKNMFSRRQKTPDIDTRKTPDIDIHSSFIYDADKGERDIHSFIYDDARSLSKRSRSKRSRKNGTTYDSFYVGGKPKTRKNRKRIH